MFRRHPLSALASNLGRWYVIRTTSKNNLQENLENVKILKNDLYHLFGVKHFQEVKRELKNKDQLTLN